jgi:hypothetical protein
MYELTLSAGQASTCIRALKGWSHALAGEFRSAAALVTVYNENGAADSDEVGTWLDIASDALKGSRAKAADVQGTLDLAARIPDAGGAIQLAAAEARLLKSALDLLCRLHLGQYWILEETTMWNDAPGERRMAARDILTKAGNAATGLPGHASWGINNRKVDDEARVAWDLTKVIRHRLAWDAEPQGGIYVDFDKPERSSRSESLATFGPAGSAAPRRKLTGSDYAFLLMRAPPMCIIRELRRSRDS